MVVETIIPAWIFFVSVIVASLLILSRSANWIIYGITRYAKKLGLSDALIGLFVISLAASLPEIIAAIMGLIMGAEDITFGTLIGTNMVHLALVTGVLSLVGKKISLECKILEKSKLLILGLLILPFLLMSDGELTRPDGILLITGFLLYLFVLWKKEGSFGQIKKVVNLK